jgi:hypothetical protein
MNFRIIHETDSIAEYEFTECLHQHHVQKTDRFYNGEKLSEASMNIATKRISTLLIVSMFLLSACRANISRNDNGSLTVETTITQQELQDVVSASIADPLVKNVTVSLQSGYVLVSGERQRLNDSSKSDALTFRLDLGVSNGGLTCSISNAQLDGKPIEQNRVDNWNQTIANRISRIGQKNQNSTLQSVTITPSTVMMTWIVTR